MNAKLKGTICGIISAISYGTNPLGALFLYEEGINTNSVLFYRFSIASVIIAALMLIQKESFKISKKELIVVATLGVMFATSALSLFSSFHYMDAGVASTLLFVYPVMVALIMASIFKEKISFTTILSIILALGGVSLLCKNDAGTALNTFGIILVMVSSLTYALYIIVVNKSALKMSSIKLTFYVLLFCILSIVVYSFKDNSNHIQLLTTPSAWIWASMLALVPTIVSLVFMAIAVHSIGSTATAITGALEPLTAIVIGVTIFGEAFSMRLAVGIFMILFAVNLIIMDKSAKMQKLYKKLNHIGGSLKKHSH